MKIVPKKYNGRRTCAILSCSSASGIKYHQFPQSLDLKEKWLKACRLSPTDPRKDLRICHVHFAESDYRIGRGIVRKRLKSRAVPNLCLPPEHLPPYVDVHSYSISKENVAAEQVSTDSNHERTEEAIEQEEVILDDDITDKENTLPKPLFKTSTPTKNNSASTSVYPGVESSDNDIVFENKVENVHVPYVDVHSYSISKENFYRLLIARLRAKKWNKKK